MRVLALLCLGAVSVRVGARQTPKALLINLPKHEERFRTVKEQLDAAEVTYEKANAVDGRQLTVADQERKVTALGRALMTPGMIGCFLSHRACWERCVEMDNGPIIVFEDDVVLADNFTAMLHAAMDELPDDWDVLLLGALGAVHPNYYFFNGLHAFMAGGLRWPRGARQAFYGKKPVAVHTPLRPFGTHAYVISPAGAKKLLQAAPRANYHVDVVAWGLRKLKLFAVHPLLAKQTHGDTTIGGMHDRSWLPEIIIDPYTGTDFAWAWNAPLIQIGGRGGLLLTSGRSVGTFLVGVLSSLALMKWPLLPAKWVSEAVRLLVARILLGLTLATTTVVYSLLTALIWQQQPRPLPAADTPAPSIEDGPAPTAEASAEDASTTAATAELSA